MTTDVKAIPQRPNVNDRRVDVRTPIGATPPAFATEELPDLRAQPKADAPARPAATFTIHASLSGFPIDVAFSGSFEQAMAAVERLQALGATPPPRPSFGGGKPPQKPLTQPLVNDAGDPCCTVHTRRDGQPLPIRYYAGKDGRPGFWGCIAKAQGVAGEQINQNGYCSLKFDWAAPAEGK